MAVKNNKFRRLAKAHHAEKAQDYVEMIRELVREQGEARLTEIAKRFAVTNVTAHKILLRLQKEKLVSFKPYRALFLTPKGKKMARLSYQRHETVLKFLKKLGVPDAAAQIDAEGIEHHVSPQTLKILRRYIQRNKK